MFAQDNEQKRSGFNFSIYKGYAVAGYVDDGGFINFTGPNIIIRLKNLHSRLGCYHHCALKETQAHREILLLPQT